MQNGGCVGSVSLILQPRPSLDFHGLEYNRHLSSRPHRTSLCTGDYAKTGPRWRCAMASVGRYHYNTLSQQPVKVSQHHSNNNYSSEDMIQPNGALQNEEKEQAPPAFQLQPNRWLFLQRFLMFFCGPQFLHRPASKVKSSFKANGPTDRPSKNETTTQRTDPQSMRQVRTTYNDQPKLCSSPPPTSVTAATVSLGRSSAISTRVIFR